MSRRVLRFVLRAALRAFPVSFRERLGEDLEAAFEDGLARVAASGGSRWAVRRRAPGFVIRTLANVVSEGLRERLRRASWRSRRHRSGTVRSVAGRRSWRGETGERQRSSMVERFASDAALGLRQLARRPLFAVVAVLTLGLGVGANTAIFSVIDGVLLSPLPYPEPDRIVSAWVSLPRRGVLRWGLSLHDYEDWKSGPTVFESFAVYNANTANLGGIETPQRISYAQVTPEIFRVLGVMPRLGRAFREEENASGAADVVIVSDGFWRDRMGSDPGAVGRTVTLDGSPVTVIGVMPEGFAFPSGTELWKPFGMTAEEEGSRGGRWVNGVGRLHPGESLESARAAMSAFAVSLARAYPETNRDTGIYLEPLLASIVSSVRPSLLILWGAVGLVLLIAGANVAGLILARSVDRRTEFAVRSALGAGRRRLIGQLLAESLPLSLLGGLCGIAFGWGGAHLLSILAVTRVPRAGNVALDGAVLLYSVGIALLAGIGFSLVPAISVTRTNVATRIREGARGSAGAARVRAREALVVAQMALAVLVLIGAGLLVRTFRAVSATSPGFETAGLLTFRIAPSWSEIADRGQAADLFGSIVAEIRSTPGVLAAGAVNRLPLSGPWWATTIRREGDLEGAENDGIRAYTRVVTPGYLEAIGLQILRGRGPLESDRADGTLVVAINREMAERVWPGEDAIGKRFSIGGRFWYEVVGIVGDERFNSLSQPTAPVMYMPFCQGTFGHFQDWGMTVVLRTAGDPAAMVETIRARVQRIAPSIPVFAMNTFDSILNRDVAGQRFNAVLFGAFGLLALVLSAIGVYGLLAFIVMQRTSEIGVRMAMGAARPAILRLIIGRGALLATIGSAIGIASALLLTRLLANMLVGVGTRDALSFGTGALILLGVVLAACIVPAWRATRIAPASALRSE